METLQQRAARMARKADDLALKMKNMADAMQSGKASIDEFNAAVNAYKRAECDAQIAKDRADGVIYD